MIEDDRLFEKTAQHPRLRSNAYHFREAIQAGHDRRLSACPVIFNIARLGQLLLNY